MSIVALDEFGAALTTGQRLLGLDLGEKTIGVALSDLSRSVATPMETLRRGKFSADAPKLEVLLVQHAIGGIVIGLPINMDGSDGPSAQSARAFGRNLMARIATPILFWDERLSTVAVTRTLIEADTSRRKRADVVDKMAAAYILQGVLDRLRYIAGR